MRKWKRYRKSSKMSMYLHYNQLFNYSVIVMRSTFKILFYLNTSKKKKSGLCPVIGRITVDGKIAQFSLKVDVHPDCWDAKSERTTGKTREQTDLNSKIKQTEQSIRDIYQRTVDIGGFVTAGKSKTN